MEHPTMTLYTPDGDYTIELLSGTLENGDREFVRFRFESEEDFTGYIQSLQSRSTFSSHGTAVPGDRLVSLCTCTYEQNNARYLVVGKLLPVSESGSRRKGNRPAAGFSAIKKQPGIFQAVFAFCIIPAVRRLCRHFSR
ncbi:MAG: class B sortase [Acutalibacteraceae bacterium]